MVVDTTRKLCIIHGITRRSDEKTKKRSGIKKADKKEKEADQKTNEEGYKKDYKEIF